MRISAIFVKTCLLILLFCLAACKGATDLGQEMDQASEGSSEMDQLEEAEPDHPIMDGTIKDQEWQNATVRYFEDGSELYLKVSGDHLYLAVRAVGGGMIAGNVFLSEADRILVMHTSAALGTALYQKDGDVYKKIRDFDWCCRSKIDDEASRLAREAFYSEEGWLGQNSFLGTANELEYKISLKDQPERVAVNFIHADGSEDKQVWPIGLKDGVSLPSSGGFPDSIEFSVEEWISLEDFR